MIVCYYIDVKDMAGCVTLEAVLRHNGFVFLNVTDRDYAAGMSTTLADVERIYSNYDDR